MNQKANAAARSGGLYSKIKMSLHAANILVAASVIALIAVSAVIIANAGFIVSFETDGGSDIAPQKVFHSEYIKPTEIPTKEGYVFTGWYTDSDRLKPWNTNENAVTQSMTLYAGWERSENRDISQ